jgi:hypothetical protein
MGAGASIPSSIEDARLEGYTQEQIDNYCKQSEGIPSASCPSKASENDAALAAPLESEESSSLGLLKRAVTVSFLRELCDANSAWKTTTRDVVEKVIKPATLTEAGAPRRYADLVPREKIGHPHIFVSHSWDNPFGLIVLALEDFCSSNGKDPKNVQT